MAPGFSQSGHDGEGCQYHKHQRVYVRPVGTWAIVERVVPQWTKGLDEPLRIFYDGRPWGGNSPPRNCTESEMTSAQAVEWRQRDLAHRPAPATNGNPELEKPRRIPIPAPIR